LGFEEGSRHRAKLGTAVAHELRIGDAGRNGKGAETPKPACNGRRYFP